MIRFPAPEGSAAFYRIVSVLLFLGMLFALKPGVGLGKRQANGSVTVVSAASFLAPVAPNSIAAAYGVRLAVRAETAGSSLPTNLAGTTVRVSGVLASLFFVSAGQVNFLIPEGTPTGAAPIVITSGDGAISSGIVQVSAIAPAVFSADARGTGAPAAVLLRVKPDGLQVAEPITQFDPVSNRFLFRPIVFGGAGERLFLVLYLCGIRNVPDMDGNSMNGVAESIRVMVGGKLFASAFAGPAPGFVGLDQINVELLPILSGRAAVQVEYADVTSNLTEIEVAAPGRAPSVLTLTSSTPQAIHGQAVVFTAQVSGEGGLPTGEIIFRDGATRLSVVPLVAGRALLSAALLGAGIHRVAAHYSGDARFSGSWARLSDLTVAKASTSLAVVSSPNPSVVGQSLGLVARVAVVSPGGGIPGGRVIFTEGGRAIGSAAIDSLGAAAFNLSLPTAGRRDLAANYEGDGNFLGSNGVLTGGQIVNKGAVQVRISSSANPSAKDQVVRLTAVLSAVSPAAGMPSGVVQFKDRGVNLGTPITLIDGRAELSVATLSLGGHLITAEFFGDPNFLGGLSASLEQNITASMLQIGGLIRPALAYAGDEIVIQGSGFSSDPLAHEVQVIDDGGNRTTAKVEAAGADQLRVRIPFGAGSGRVRVGVQGSEGESPDRLHMATSVSGFVQEAVRLADGSVQRLPVQGVRLRAFGPAGLIAFGVTNVEGAFVIKFPANAVFADFVDLEVEEVAASGALPFPNQKRKVSVSQNRDNQYHGDRDSAGNLLANIIELKRAGTATTNVVAANEPIRDRLTASLDHEAAISPTQIINSGSVTFDANNSTIVCPAAAACSVTLTPLDAGRTPSNLPAGYFSSTIVQLTPFGATLSPGGRLSFPNVDGISAGTPIRVFRFDQTTGSPTLGRFVDIGPASLSADGARIDTANNAVTTTSYYFASRLWPTTTAIGHVVDADGRAVRRAVVSARGQSVFTDNNGGFVLANLPVITPGGVNDQATIEISFVRPDGSVTRAQRTLLNLQANVPVQIPEDFVLPRAGVNRPPLIQAPPSLTMIEGETRDFSYLAVDPDGHPLNAVISGTPFATLLPGGAPRAFRVALPANSAGTYQLRITVTDQPGSGASASATHVIALLVLARAESSLRAYDSSVVTNEDAPVAITLNVAPSAGGALAYSILAPPTHGVLRGSAPNLIYTPAVNYFGPDSLSFKVTTSGGESNVAVVFISVAPVNDPPVLILSTPSSTALNAGETLRVDVTATDADAESTLSFTVTGLPAGALFSPAANGALFSWTPVYTQKGQYVVNFFVQDGAGIVQQRSLSIDVAAKWAKTSGPDGGTITSFAFDGARGFAGTYGSAAFFSNNEGRSWINARKGIPDEGLVVYSLAFLGANVFAATQTSGVYRSADDGRNWEAVNNGLKFPDGSFPYISVAYAKGSALFLGAYEGVYRSLNNGVTWSQRNSGLQSSCGTPQVLAYVAKGNILFAGTNRGIFRSDNDGDTWRPVNTGLPPYPNNCGLAYVNGLFVKGAKVYAATDGGLYETLNDGQNWGPAGRGLPSASFHAVAEVGGRLLAAGVPGLYASVDGGQTWAISDRGLPRFYGDIPLPVGTVAASGSVVYAGTGPGVYRSLNNGLDWSEVNSGISAQTVTEVISSGDDLYAGTVDSGVFRSDNGGRSWTKVNTGFLNFDIFAMAASGEKLFAGTGLAGVYRSVNKGAEWVRISQGLPDFKRVEALAVRGATLYAGLADGNIFEGYKDLFGGGIYRSVNDGASWSPLNANLPRANDGKYPCVNAIALSDGAIYLGTQGSGVFRSANEGASWVSLNLGLPRNSNGSYPSVNAILQAGTSLLIATSDGVFRSLNNGANWSKVLNQSYVNSLGQNGNVLFAGAGVIFSNPRLNQGGIWMSLDNGATWAPIRTALTNQIIASLALQNGNLFAGSAGGGVALLSNNVQSWNELNTGLANRFTNAITVRNSQVFVGTLGSGVYRSPDQGQNWQAASLGLPANANVQALLSNGGDLLAGLFGGGVYRSSNDGVSWAFSGLTGQNINALKLGGGAIFAATDNGVYRSTDRGGAWEATGLRNQRVASLAYEGGRLYAGIYGGGIQISSNNGSSWTPAGSLGNSYVTALTIGPDGATLFAGTDGGGLFRSSDGGMSWAPVLGELPANLNVYAFSVSGNKLYMGSIYGVFLSEDNGQHWRQLNAGLLDIYVTSLAVTGNQLLAGTRVGGVFISRIP